MDIVDFGRYAGALLVTLGLLLGLGWAMRRFNLLSNLRGEGGDRRVSIVETAALDARRRLALVRLDGREHLILLGVSGETLLESRDAPPAPAPEAAGPAPGGAS